MQTTYPKLMIGLLVVGAVLIYLVLYVFNKQHVRDPLNTARHVAPISAYN